MVLQVFGNHLEFQKSMKAAFQKFMNKKAKEVPNVELLVAYCDGVLKGHEGSDKLDDNAMEERLENAMKLFVFLADVFAELYREKLAKRLLNKKSTSMETEKQMISKMKQLQGPPFTTKVRGFSPATISRLCAACSGLACSGLTFADACWRPR